MNDLTAQLVPAPDLPDGFDAAEWRNNLSDAARYGGIAPDLSREQEVRAEQCDPHDPAPGVFYRFREVLVNGADHDWVDKTLAGLSHKPLWRDDDTEASISLVRFEKGAGIPSRHSHASNQFMYCLSGQYTYLPTGITLVPGSFYWNPKGSLHGPTRADEETVLLEIYDGPHYPTQPEWYSSPDDAR